ncbi:SDR family NAD(P)-dependent oxidoreductase [Sphingomonas sp. G-3-2-10]|uniref:SDR family NAD(P)-dependent oxidoreductase n=1 Tax=Sphingomonas sp. G-3-2-10 TaxID=2728838 RepID=UPI0032172059
MTEFAARYGSWAVVTGASEGTGRAFARALAAKGIASILVARREAPLAALADEIRAEFGIDCVHATIDLAAPDAIDRIAEATGDREVGLFISNAGADPNGARFLDRDIGVWLDLIRRNDLTMLGCVHHFARPMRDRGRGGILLVNSGACYGGSRFMAAYSASKAFTLTFAEGLWDELREHGVDVLTLVMGMTDTPALRALLGEKDLPVPDGIARPEDVAALGLERLSHGPVLNWGLEDEAPAFGLTSAADRRKRAIAIGAASARVFGD